MQRRIDVEGCHNFRDLGGHPTSDGRRVRWRQLFRADALQHLTSQGAERVRKELEVGAVIDLRSGSELEREGRGLLADDEIEFHHLPIPGETQRREVLALAPGFALDELYFHWLVTAGEGISRVIHTLAAAEAPAVFHCTMGKDRTGVIAAATLGALGVEDDAVVADYAATHDSIEPIIERLSRKKGFRRALKRLSPHVLQAEPESMAGLLRRTRDAYGSMRGYVREIGIPESTLAQLEDRLLES